MSIDQRVADWFILLPNSRHQKAVDLYETQLTDYKVFSNLYSAKEAKEYALFPSSPKELQELINAKYRRNRRANKSSSIFQFLSLIAKGDWQAAKLVYEIRSPIRVRNSREYKLLIQGDEWIRNSNAANVRLRGKL